MCLRSKWERYQWPRASLSQVQLCRGLCIPQTHYGFAPTCRLVKHVKDTWKWWFNEAFLRHKLPLQKYWSLIKMYSMCCCSVHTRRGVIEVKIPTKHVKHHHFIFSSGHCLKLTDPFGQHVKLLKAYLSVPWSNTTNVLIFDMLQSILYIFVQLYYTYLCNYIICNY